MNIIGLGYNYKQCYKNGKHLDEPVIFLKGENTLVNGDSFIKYPKNVGKVWVEAELAIVIGKGYTFANDVTAENIHGRDHHLARSKSLDRFCPMWDGLVGFDEINPNNQQYYTYINNKLIQSANTKDMIFNCEQIIDLVSENIFLRYGDIILTGTHPGNAPFGCKGHIMTDGIIHVGDVVKIEFPEIGSMKHRVIE